jgi:hypothetical protein
MEEFEQNAIGKANYDILNHLNDKNFKPTPFTNHHFTNRLVSGGIKYDSLALDGGREDEIDLIRQIKVQILDAEEEIKQAESAILMDKKNYEMEKEVSQATLMYEVEDFLKQYTSIKTEVKSCLNSTSVNDE